jgi:hypothetical protein
MLQLSVSLHFKKESKDILWTILAIFAICPRGDQKGRRQRKDFFISHFPWISRKKIKKFPFARPVYPSEPEIFGKINFLYFVSKDTLTTCLIVNSNTLVAVLFSTFPRSVLSTTEVVLDLSLVMIPLFLPISLRLWVSRLV